MKKIFSLCLSLIILITISTSIFANESSAEPTSSTTVSYFPPEIQSKLSEISDTRLYPVVQIPTITNSNMSFDDVKASANFYELFIYEGNIPTGTKSYRYKDGELVYSGGSRLTPDNLGSHQYPNDVKSFGDADIVILTDPQTAYILTADEVIIPLHVADQGISVMSPDRSCSLKDFLNAAVYRNRYVDIHSNSLGGAPTSVYGYLGYKPPVSPIVYVICGAAVFVLATIVIVYLRKRKSKKNSI